MIPVYQATTDNTSIIYYGMRQTKSGLRRVRNLCMLVLRLCSAIVASHHVVDTVFYENCVATSL